MIEAPSFVSVINPGILPKNLHPNHANIPLDLICATNDLGEKRARFIENRVLNIISSRNKIVESVCANKTYGNEDGLGHDLTVILTGKSNIKTVYIQVKSSRHGVVEYNKYIRDKYFKGQENSPELVKRWRTEHGIILINGSETKTDKEILKNSFYPQLKRIQRDIRRRRKTESSGQMKLYSDVTPIQIFPASATSEQLTLLPFS